MEMIELPYRRIELHRMGSTLYLYPMRYTWICIQGDGVGYCECLVKVHNELYKIGVFSLQGTPRVYHAIYELYRLLGYDGTTSIQDFVRGSVRNQFTSYFSNIRDYEREIELYDEAFTYAKRVLQGIWTVRKVRQMFRRTTRNLVNQILNYGITASTNEPLCPTYHDYVNREI